MRCEAIQQLCFLLIQRSEIFLPSPEDCGSSFEDLSFCDDSESKKEIYRFLNREVKILEKFYAKGEILPSFDLFVPSFLSPCDSLFFYIFLSFIWKTK